tara:strand:+ start:675 stop:1064 length:390 start_codon:yes stop_codon:yes gene_type:complete
MMKEYIFLFALLLAGHNGFAQKATLAPGAIIHQVFFWLEHPDAMEDKAALKEGLETLNGISEVEMLVLGEPASTMVREVVVSDWDVSETMFFGSTEDQDIYQNHPLHQAFIKEYGYLWKKVVVYDIRLD